MNGRANALVEKDENFGSGCDTEKANRPSSILISLSTEWGEGAFGAQSERTRESRENRLTEPWHSVQRSTIDGGPQRLRKARQGARLWCEASRRLR